ncbi:hypothetical protein F4782DRAFT_551663 [Xylaria castorea]|nr:hypothetical protein F4782DRAFT_551663 [Xylaria castorea]
MLFKTQKYSSLPTSPTSLESLQPKRRKCNAFGTGISVPLVLNIVLLLIVSVLSFLLGRRTISLEQCGKILSTWSPIIDVVEYEETTFEGSFLAPSVWRGEPTPELDAAWDRISLGGMGSIRISKDELQLLNKSKDADITVGFPDEGVTDTDYGQKDVQVILEVFHQLHCLNEIRKKTWPEYYPKSEKKYEKVDRAHIGKLSSRSFSSINILMYDT